MTVKGFVVKGILAGVVIAGLYTLGKLAVSAGYDAGYSAARADMAQQASAEWQRRETELRAEFDRRLNAANNAAETLRTEKRAIQSHAEALREDIDHVTQRYRAATDAMPEPLPECIFTDGFVGLYNNAIRTDPAATAVSGADISSGTAETPGATGVADTSLRPSDIRQSDILHHITDYGARCRAIEAQLNGLIDYLMMYQEGE